MVLNVNTVRSKILSILLIIILGFSLQAFNAYHSDRKLRQLNNKLFILQQSQSRLDQLKGLIEENMRLLMQVSFHKKTRLSGKLLAKNEDILHAFEAFRSDAYDRELDEDYNFAIENEPLILSLRRDFYKIVISAKRGNYQNAQLQTFHLIDHRIRPIMGFMHSAEILRNLRTMDTKKELSALRLETSRNAVIIFGIIFLVTLIFILFITKSITRPLKTLLNAVQKISHSENLSVRVAIDSSDEIGQLSNSFNHMISQLEHSKNNTAELNQKLESASNKLTQEAETREQLILQLEDKNSELERFTYTVSHDLKSPLVTVKGFIGLLKNDIKDDAPERIDNDLQHIATAVDQMAVLLNDLMELSRIGRVINKPQSIPLTDLFEQALTLIHGQVMEADAKISIQADMPPVYADKHRMLEVAQNLLDNAIKFRQKNIVPEVSVTASIMNDQVICCISDNGIGINPDYHNKIFGLFDRLDLSFEGTGVGLALVKRIIEVHNGNLTVESKGDGDGTRFYFSLPMPHVK